LEYYILLSNDEAKLKNKAEIKNREIDLDKYKHIPDAGKSL